MQVILKISMLSWFHKSPWKSWMAPFCLGRLVLRNTSNMRSTFLVNPLWISFALVRLKYVTIELLWTHVWIEFPHIYASHLDLKDQYVELVPEVSLEILDGPVLLGQLVLRNASKMISAILFDPSWIPFALVRLEYLTIEFLWICLDRNPFYTYL